MRRKKLPIFPILLLLVLTVLNTLNLKMMKASAAVSPYIAVVPESTINETLTSGMNYTISICTDYAGDDVWGYEFTLTYNSSVLEGVEVVNGDLITEETGTTMFASAGFNNTAGELGLTGNGFFFIPPPAPLTSGPGTLANITFRVVGVGTSDITLGPETKLISYAEDGYGDMFNIIDAETQPDHIQHGFFSNVLHDIAVTSVTTSPSIVEIGEPVSINVMVTNEGDVSETFNVTVYYDDTLIATNTSCWENPLSSKDEITFIVDWDTTGVRSGIYNITANASTVPSETDTADNVGWDRVTIVGPPMASFTYSPEEPIVDETVTFDASASYDPDGEIVSYAWNFGDGTTAVYVKDVNLTAITTHTYTVVGVYTVNLTVTDKDDETDTTTTDVAVSLHDIVITSVTSSPTSVEVGDFVDIAVAVKNQGMQPETFNVTAYYDTSPIGTHTSISLDAGESDLVSFSWDTTGVAGGTYTINAEASQVPREANITNNKLTDGTVTIKKLNSTISLATPTSITVGKSTAINGSVAPLRAGVTVTIWYRLGEEETWNTLATVQTNETSQYSYDWTPETAGTCELKASWPGDDYTLSAESDTVTITVQEAAAPDIIPYVAAAGVAAIIIAAIAFYLLRIRKPI